MTLRNHYIYIEKAYESDHPSEQLFFGCNGDKTSASDCVDEVRADCYLCGTLGTGGVSSRGSGSFWKSRRTELRSTSTTMNRYGPRCWGHCSRQDWRNYPLFMRKEGLLFGYFEAEDSFQSSLYGMKGQNINRQWQEFMEPYFEIPPGSHPDQVMVELIEVFHLD